MALKQSKPYGANVFVRYVTDLGSTNKLDSVFYPLYGFTRRT